MSSVVAGLPPFIFGALAIILITISINAEEQGASWRARQLRELALALALLVVILQMQRSGLPIKGRIVLAALGTIALIVPLRHHGT